MQGEPGVVWKAARLIEARQKELAKQAVWDIVRAAP